MEKSEARILVRQKRQALSLSELKRLSVRLCENASFFVRSRGLQSVSVFLSYDREPVTDHFVSYCLAQGIRVFVPVADYSNRLIYHAELKDLAFVEKDEKGIRIPEDRKELLSPEEMTVQAVFCPGMAFDLRGNRVGHGEGLYDRMLEKIPFATRVGLCFTFQIFESIETEPHDIGMDFLITEREIIEI